MTRQRLSKAPTKKSSPAIAAPSLQQTPDFSLNSQSVEKPQNPNFSGLSHELSFPIQAKLTIGEPNDKYEQEADRVADQVVKQIHAPDISKSENEQIRCKDNETEGRSPQITPLKSSTLKKKDEGVSPITSNLESSIRQVRDVGQKLPRALQPKMEQAFGSNFSAVRIHADSNSDRLSRSIQAKAFTTGQDIFFRKGAYQPSSRAGQHLLAHELTHVVQQNSYQTSRSSYSNNFSMQTLSIQRDLEATDYETGSIKDKRKFRGMAKNPEWEICFRKLSRVRVFDPSHESTEIREMGTRSQVKAGLTRNEGIDGISLTRNPWFTRGVLNAGDRKVVYIVAVPPQWGLDLEYEYLKHSGELPKEYKVAPSDTLSQNKKSQEITVERVPEGLILGWVSRIEEPDAMGIRETVLRYTANPNWAPPETLSKIDKAGRLPEFWRMIDGIDGVRKVGFP